jgi:hypothetical protein
MITDRGLLFIHFAISPYHHWSQERLQRTCAAVVRCCVFGDRVSPSPCDWPKSYTLNILHVDQPLKHALCICLDDTVEYVEQGSQLRYAYKAIRLVHRKVCRCAIGRHRADQASNSTVANRDIKDKTPNSEPEANAPNVSYLFTTLHTGCNVD